MRSRQNRLVKPCLEALEDRLLPAPTLAWSPVGNTNASDKDNWVNTANGLRDTSPATTAGCTLQLGNTNYFACNSPIIWDNNGAQGMFTYAIGLLQLMGGGGARGGGGYSSVEDVNTGVTLSCGNISTSGGTDLALQFNGASNDPRFGSYVSDNGSNTTINSFNLNPNGASPSLGNFSITGTGMTLLLGTGHTYIVDNSEWDVDGGLTLQQQASTATAYLNMVGAYALINVNGGMTFQDQTFVSNFVGTDGSNTNAQKINVGANGSLTFATSNADFCNVPIYVKGSMTVTGGNTSSSSLEVYGSLQAPNAAPCSVVVQSTTTTTGALYLQQQATLTCQASYYQGASGSAFNALMQVDTSTDTLKVLNSNTIYIDQYSTVTFTTYPNAYGVLDFVGNVVFNGTFRPYIDGGDSTNRDQLAVSGDTSIQFGATAYINPYVHGTLTYTSWTVITNTGLWNGWSNVGVAPNFTDQVQGVIAYNP